MARKALREGSWRFNEKDPTQSACLRSLGFAQPLESVGFRKYKAEACLGWLKTPKGDVLSDATRLRQGGGQPTTPKSEALAIVASPSCLRPKGNKEAAVSMGLVFISPYIEVVSFASAHIALKDWMEEEGLLEETRVLFVQLGPSSQLQPHCVGYPVFLDPIHEDRKVASDDSWAVADLRAFGLQGVTLSLPGTGPHVFVMLPHLFTAARGSLWWNSCCIPPTEEELEAAGPNLLQGGPAKVTFAKPSELHWTVVADKSFSAFCKKAREKAVAEKKDGTPSTTLGGGGGVPIPGTSRTGGLPEAPKSCIPDPFPDNPTPAQLRDTTAELLRQAQEMHVESLFKTGSIRLVDRLLTEALMTEFARLGMILSEDLVASLRAFRTQVKGSCDNLFREMVLALSHLPREAVGQEPYRIINEYSWAMRRDTSSLLATVHLALADMKDFLDKRLEDAGSVGETKLITKALLDWFNNHFERIQKVTLHPAMCNSQVSNIMGASMAALQPLSTFTFTSVVDQVIDRIGLTVPTKPKKDGDPGVPIPDEAGSHQVGSRYLDAQFKALLREVCEGNEDTRPSWYKPEGLHLEYWKDFESRYPNYVVPALPVSIFDQAEEEMRQLRELVPHAPPVDLRVMGVDELWQEICNTSPSQWQKKFESILEAQWHHQSRPQPDPPAPSAPTGAPKDPEPLEPEGGGDPGDPEVKEEDRPQEPPSKPPGPPLKPLVIRAQPQAKDGLEAKEEPRQRSQRQRTG